MHPHAENVARALASLVWAAGGHVRTVFPTTFAELVAITGGEPAEVAGADRLGCPHARHDHR